mmetsp:Transcript_7945/g.17639  ORF Transcript_7945/g.17639 Transcript_7945/m.17639 type:complete len:807 (+) Transcript_7945:107-2527(+)
MGCGASSASSPKGAAAPSSQPAAGQNGPSTGASNPPANGSAAPAPAPAPVPAPAPAPAPAGDRGVTAPTQPSVAPAAGSTSKPPAADTSTAVPRSVPAPAPGTKWWEVELPDVVVTRKELRGMTTAEQDRFAAAVMKMRENDDGLPGSSQYFRLAVIHGGMNPLPEDKYPEYCAHRRECFPTWHRPYLMDFEKTLRRADMALGGDGNIGLPYWDWTKTEVNGEVLPRIVREKLMVEFPEDFFGDGKVMVTPFPGRHGYRMSATRSDDGIRRLLLSSDVAGQAARCLHSLRHSQHATTAFSNSRFVSLESPHNSVHGIVSGIMASFQSSFHPSFWLHHANVDRFYEKYIGLETDSAQEFMRHQQSQNPRPAAGFPDGPWGRYEPFTHPRTGEQFHARDCFNAKDLGYSYDELPPLQAPQMREPPFFAVFKSVDIRKMEHPRLLYVFVAPKDATWTAPASEPTEDASFAGIGSIFFFDTPGGCANCKINPITDIFVDITQALRRNNLRPSRTALHVLVEDAAGSLIPISESPVPVPQLKGPQFSSMEELLKLGQKPGDVAEDDVKALQGLLKEYGTTDAETCGGDFGNPDGDFGPMTEAATRKLQRMAGQSEDGVVGPQLKKALLLSRGLHKDASLDQGRLEVNVATPIKWKLNFTGLPPQLKGQAVAAELSQAFAQWGEALGLNFIGLDESSSEAAHITIAFSTLGSDDTVFDGPGGSLANATPSAITFDADERWELSSARHPHRAFMDWDDQYFTLLPVALHEIGHVLGLGHSADPIDVMSPFYLQDRIRLSSNDIATAKALHGLA